MYPKFYANLSDFLAEVNRLHIASESTRTRRIQKKINFTLEPRTLQPAATYTDR